MNKKQREALTALRDFMKQYLIEFAPSHSGKVNVIVFDQDDFSHISVLCECRADLEKILKQEGEQDE
jgi:hypothetical protein